MPVMSLGFRDLCFEYLAVRTIAVAESIYDRWPLDLLVVGVREYITQELYRGYTGIVFPHSFESTGKVSSHTPGAIGLLDTLQTSDGRAACRQRGSRVAKPPFEPASHEESRTPALLSHNILLGCC